MPLFQSEVEFKRGGSTECVIICGAEDVNVVRQSGYFPSKDGDVPTWLVIKPNSVGMSGGDLYATLMFGGTAASFEKRCSLCEVATVNLNSSQPFTVTVRFLP